MDKSKKVLIISLYILGIVTFLEITFYFIYIFKPLDRLLGKDVGTPRGIPTASELLAPSSSARYVMQSNESKTFYSKRLEDYTKNLNSIIESKSTFVKIAEANSVLGGVVKAIKEKDDGGFDIVLNDPEGNNFTQTLSAVEVQYVQVFLERQSGSNYSKSKKYFSDITINDFVSIKRSINLLNPAEENIEITILTID